MEANMEEFEGGPDSGDYGDHNGFAPSPREEFKDLVAHLEATLGQIDAVYPPMIAKAEGFDRELARRLAATMDADRSLLTYVRSKAESGVRLPPGVIALLAR